MVYILCMIWNPNDLFHIDHSPCQQHFVCMNIIQYNDCIVHFHIHHMNKLKISIFNYRHLKWQINTWTILPQHRVTIITRSAIFTCSSKWIMQTQNTLSCGWITTTSVCHINVSTAITWLTWLARDFGSSEVTSSTNIASITIISMFTLTLYFKSVWWDLTTRCKTKNLVKLILIIE